MTSKKWIFVLLFVIIGTFYAWIYLGFHRRPVSDFRIYTAVAGGQRIEAYTDIQKSCQQPQIKRKSAIENQDIHKVKNLVLRSRWIHLFPHLKEMALKITSKPPEEMTGAQNTKVFINGNNGDPGHETYFEIGGTLDAVIIATDEKGCEKSYGGDYFVAILRPVNQTIDGVSCPVIDLMDGTYDIKCILPFGGDAELLIKMMHPSESVFKMMALYSSTHEYETTMQTKMKNSKNVFEYTDCSVGFPEEKSKALCNYTNPTHGEPYMCKKPPSGECNALLEQTMKPRMNKLRFYDKRYFVKGYNYNVNVNVIKVHIATSPLTPFDAYKIKDRQELSLDPMEATGWFWKRKWVSRKVEVHPYSAERVTSCLRDKDLYFIGDSTVRQWYYHLVAQLKLGDIAAPRSAWSRPRDSRHTQANFSLHFRPAGPPFHNNGAIWPFITDILDHVTEGGNGTVLFLTAGLHFELFTPDAFLDRITRIKHAVTSLLDRLPSSKVIIKGLHYHDPNPPFVISQWKTQLLEVIMRNAFKGINNVYYFETWDFMFVRGNKLVHPEDDALRENVAVLTSYIC